MPSSQPIPKQNHHGLTTGSPADPRLFHADSDDNIQLYPAGQGYHQEILLQDGLSLAIVDYTLHQNILIEKVERRDWLKFEFQLSGPDNGYSFYNFRPGTKDFWFTPKRGKVFEVEIIIKRPLLDQYLLAVMKRLPEKGLKLILEYLYSGSGDSASGLMVSELLDRLRMRQPEASSSGSSEPLEQYLPRFFYGEFIDLHQTRFRSNTPAMQQVTAQILSCPYKGTTRRNYLKRKAFKLIALYLEEMRRPPLPKPDLDSIYDAATILRHQITDPPSINQLTQQVYTNRFKLYQGFHTVYGTTPLGYLLNHRLNSAYHMLTTSNLSVSQVAAAVGYSNRSRFAAAFQQAVGYKPKTFQLRLQHQAS